MLNEVTIPPGLLKLTNTNVPTWAEGMEGADLFARFAFGVFVFSIIGLVAALVARFATVEDVRGEVAAIRGKLARVFQSTLITRLCLLQASLVIPLIFYVNTKEHYWTAKHTTMLFSGFLGLWAWLAVCSRTVRFRVPYAWPVALILFSATVSSLRAVNVAEGIGYLFAIFGSAVFMYLASQVISTTKRIHLLVVTLTLAAVTMSVYGLAQSYLLLPMEYVYAQETRAPVSTVGNKNYASYLLDLTIPLLFVLAASKRTRAQTLLALAGYFICRWHFALCDTRGGTISMTLGILFTTAIAAYFHGRRFRLLLYVIVLEPLLWAAMSVAKITYGDVQYWGKVLRGPDGKGLVTKALTAENLPPEIYQYRAHIANWFYKGNDQFLGIDTRLCALVGGFALALALFWAALRLKKEWTFHLGAAAVLAFLPFLCFTLSCPNDVTPQRHANAVVKAVGNLDTPNRDAAVNLVSQFALPMAKAVASYNRLLLEMHQNAAAMFSLTLFVVMAVFLLFRAYERKEDWLAGFASIGAIGVWFLVFLLLRSQGGSIGGVLGGLFSRLAYAWPIPLDGVPSLLAWMFSVIGFVVFSLGSMAIFIVATQFIPATFSAAEAQALRERSIRIGKVVACCLVFMVVVGGLSTTRMQRVRGAMWSTLWAEEEGGLVRGMFAGAHTFFNTQNKFKDQTKDGAVGFRLEIWQGCLRKIRDNPIFGIGPGNFKIIHPHPDYESSLERRILGKEVLGRKAHNDFLEDWVENGLFGLIGLLWTFCLAGALLFSSLKMIRKSRNATDVFTNTLSWGLAWSTITIFFHAQFEAPLLQPASTYPCWMLFGVIFQLNRLQRRRLLAVTGNLGDEPTLAPPAKSDPLALSAPPTTAAYELPPAKPTGLAFLDRDKAAPWVSWVVVVAIVTSVSGTVLMRQFVGEMWLRWGMICSEKGFEQFDFVFKSMDKASEVYPQQMETNYILGRYCIDAVTKLLKPWTIKTRTDLYSEAQRQENEARIAQIYADYQLRVDDLVKYAERGLEVHKRDLYMNPHYKWAHNNMGVLYDKLTEIYENLGAVAATPEEKRECADRSREYKDLAQNCYAKALEIDDLQVYALFNLGVGAYRERDFPLALKYFEKTVIASPNRGDVHYFIAKCNIALNDWAGVIDAASNLFEWGASSPRNRVTPDEKKDLQEILHQTTRIALQDGQVESASKGAKILAENYDKCFYLPLRARAAVAAGDPMEGLGYAMEGMNTCPEPISAECIFAQALAFGALGKKDECLQSFRTLVDSKVGDPFKPLMAQDPSFEIIRDTTVYMTYMGIASSSAAEDVKPATPPK